MSTSERSMVNRPRGPEPPAQPEQREAARHHRPPTRRARIAKAEEGQAGFSDDGGAEDDAGGAPSRCRRATCAGAAEEAAGPCMAVASHLCDHHERDLGRRLMQAQHAHHALRVATLHTHLDHDQCLEVVLLRGTGCRARGRLGGMHLPPPPSVHRHRRGGCAAQRAARASTWMAAKRASWARWPVSRCASPIASGQVSASAISGARPAVRKASSQAVVPMRLV